MQLKTDLKERIFEEGFAVIENIFDQQEINEILTVINNADTTRPAFRKTNDLFAIRQFFKEVPGIFKFLQINLSIQLQKCLDETILL